MVTPWEMYWLTRLDGIRDGAFAALIIALFVFIFAAVGYGVAISEDDEGTMNKTRTPLKLSSFVAVVGTLVLLLLPTMKEMAAIKVIPMIANSEQMQKLGDIGNNMLDLANDWLKELKPEKAK